MARDYESMQGFYWLAKVFEGAMNEPNSEYASARFRGNYEMFKEIHGIDPEDHLMATLMEEYNS